MALTPQLSLAILIPVLNEEASIGRVLQEILRTPGIEKEALFVVDNGSTDKTPMILSDLGLAKILEPEKGYGAACLKALECIAQKEKPPEWILFRDGDGSDIWEDFSKLWERTKDSDLVIGSRTSGKREAGSLQFLQRFGNALTCFLLRLFYGKKFTDLGPFRLVRYSFLKQLDLKDRTWGWNIEMQIRAIQKQGRIVEVPVGYKKRLGGVSKISGSLRMAIPVGFKILAVFFRLTIRNYSSHSKTTKP